MKERISIMTTCSDAYWGLMDIAGMNKAEYAIRHKYQLIFLKNEMNNALNYQERLMQILGHLRDCNWLLFMGADTCITNHTIKIEDIIEKYRDSDVIIGEDVNGINNDVMFIKNTIQSLTFFGNILSNFKNFTTDQYGMQYMESQMPNFKMTKVHQKLFNAMPYWLYDYKDHKGGQWEKGDFIFHCPGLTNDTRYKVMNKVLKEVVR